jgi:hypothetical protein
MKISCLSSSPTKSPGKPSGTALRARKQELFCFFQGSYSGFARDCGKSFQKVFECLSAFKVIEQDLDGHPSSSKDTCSAEKIGVFHDNSHEAMVSRA